MSASSHDRPSICTFTGREFWPLAPAGPVHCVDIAVGLSRVNRYGGHTTHPYNVADHSLLVLAIADSAGVNEDARKLALLHDAAEAYLGDVAGPLKRTSVFAEYRECEDRLTERIYELAGVSPGMVKEWAPIVKECDRLALELERAQIMPACDWWAPQCDGLPDVSVVARPPDDAAALFLLTLEGFGLRGLLGWIE